jgi:hypothetical protein
VSKKVYAAYNGEVKLVTSTDDIPKDALLFWPSQINAHQVLEEEREKTKSYIRMIRERFKEAARHEQPRQ